MLFFVNKNQPLFLYNKSYNCQPSDTCQTVLTVLIQRSDSQALNYFLFWPPLVSHAIEIKVRLRR